MALTKIIASQKLRLCWECYVIIPREIKVLEEIMRSDKRIKFMQITTLINQKGRGLKNAMPNK